MMQMLSQIDWPCMNGVVALSGRIAFYLGGHGYPLSDIERLLALSCKCVDI